MSSATGADARPVRRAGQATAPAGRLARSCRRRVRAMILSARKAVAACGSTSLIVEVGEGDVVVDAGLPLLDRAPADDDGAQAGQQRPDRDRRRRRGRRPGRASDDAVEHVGRCRCGWRRPSRRTAGCRPSERSDVRRRAVGWRASRMCGLAAVRGCGSFADREPGTSRITTRAATRTAAAVVIVTTRVVPGS